ncbi:MAG: CoA-binding protein [Nitrososphaeraceae archaeon]
MNNEDYSDDKIKLIYDFKNIAVVGMSEKKEKSAHYVPKYLIEHRFNVIPINPNYDQIIGIKSFNKVSDVQSDMDIVNVFRKSEVLDVVNDIIKKKNIKIL